MGHGEAGGYIWCRGEAQRKLILIEPEARVVRAFRPASELVPGFKSALADVTSVAR